MYVGHDDSHVPWYREERHVDAEWNGLEGGVSAHMNFDACLVHSRRSSVDISVNVSLALSTANRGSLGRKIMTVSLDMTGVGR